mgnify:CR=1 FL=1
MNSHATSSSASSGPAGSFESEADSGASLHRKIILGLAVTLVVAPFVIYPVFLMKVLCFALFACAFNLLLGFGGLMFVTGIVLFSIGASQQAKHRRWQQGLSSLKVAPWWTASRSTRELGLSLDLRF